MRAWRRCTRRVLQHYELLIRATRAQPAMRSHVMLLQGPFPGEAFVAYETLVRKISGMQGRLMNSQIGIGGEFFGAKFALEIFGSLVHGTDVALQLRLVR